MRRLRISSASRWTVCTASEGLIDTMSQAEKAEANKYAVAGIKAHAIAEHCLKNNCDVSNYVSEKGVDSDDVFDLLTHVQDYLEYARSFSPKKKEIMRFVELKIDFSSIVPNTGSGVIDCAIVNTKRKELHIIDLKTGFTPVFAKNDPQLMLYAYGFIHQYKSLIEGLENYSIYLHIHQSFAQNVNSWGARKEDLNAIVDFTRNKSLEVRSHSAKFFVDAKACRNCDAKGRCPELLDVTENTLLKDSPFREFSDLDNDMLYRRISDAKLKNILENEASILLFVKNVKEDLTRRILSGKALPGYKVVNGRGMTVIKHSARGDVEMMLGDKAFNTVKKPIGVTDLKKRVPEKYFKMFTEKTVGKAELAKRSDPRQNYTPFDQSETISAFEDLSTTNDFI